LAFARISIIVLYLGALNPLDQAFDLMTSIQRAEQWPE
jgi:hypothetical protein